MTKKDKIILAGFLSALFVIVGLFLFGHFQHLTPSFGLSHAQTLHEDLTSPGSPDTQWIFNIWRIALSLANVVVIAMLIFVATVNITHLQYDTYAIKKSLPLLIIGIIMANFSLLICRMIVDAAQVLTNTFAQDARGLTENLLCGMGFQLSSNQIYFLLLSNPEGVVAGGLIVVILTLVATMIAVFILAFLLWIRKFVIFLCVAVAPVAFIMYAFPPTQTVFKQWWSWFLKWTFMGPVVMFLLWAAGQIGQGNCATISGGPYSISAQFAVCGVLYMAAVVPFKLGGGVMGAWSKFGQYVTGTKKDGYLRKPIDENIQRKKDLAKGAWGVGLGNTRVGAWMDRGRKNEEGLIANYKNRRDTQLTDREGEVRTRHADFAENEKALERAKGRLDSTIKTQIGMYIQQHRADIGREKLDSINAAGGIEREEANAEIEARGPVDSHQAITQQLREKEVEFAKNQLEQSKGNTEAVIREGAFNNLTPAELHQIYDLSGNANPDGRPTTAMDVKNRYLEQDNRLTMLKERLAKRAGQDAQVMAERDLRRNVDLRTFVKEINDGPNAVGIDAEYDLDGTQLAPGTTKKVNYAEARESAEQLRFKATTERDQRKREGLERAAKHFEAKATEFETTHATYSDDMANSLDAQERIHRADSADMTKTQAERDEAKFKADQMVERATFVRSNLGNNVEYKKRYLSNNLAGRRQKIINPDIADEIHVQEISNSPKQLIEDVKKGSYGTGEARGNQQDMHNMLTGNTHKSTEAAARASIVQLGAIQSVMKSARHGDAAGLETINGFNDLMTGAGRGKFKSSAAKKSIDSMSDKYKPYVEMEIAKQYMKSQGVNWDAMSEPDKKAAWNALGPDQEKALEGIDFTKLQVKGSGPDSTAAKDFVDRYLTQAEEDPALQLSNSAGSRLGRQRPVGEHEWTENK